MSVNLILPIKHQNIMKNSFKFLCVLSVLAVSCTSTPENQTASDNSAETANKKAGQSAVMDNVSAANIVQVASGSADHSTLVTAVKAGDLVDVLSNAGPFTVFAPTNAAFAKLPAGTVDDLLKAENKESLVNILEYHVSVGVYKEDALTDGRVLGQVNGDNITVSKKDGKTILNGKSTVVASIPTSNGIIHVVDEVLLPPAK